MNGILNRMRAGGNPAGLATPQTVSPKPAAPSGLEMMATNLLARAGIDVATIVKQATMAFDAVQSVDKRLAAIDAAVEAEKQLAPIRTAALKEHMAQLSADVAAMREELSLAIALLRRGGRDVAAEDRPLEPRDNSDPDRGS